MAKQFEDKAIKTVEKFIDRLSVLHKQLHPVHKIGFGVIGVLLLVLLVVAVTVPKIRTQVTKRIQAQVLPSDAVSYWEMSEGFGTTTADSIDANTGTFQGPLVWSSGRVGAGLRFDGNSYLDMGNPTNLRITNVITLEAWVKTSKATGGQAIITKWGNDESLSYWFGINEKKASFRLGAPGAASVGVTGAIDIADGQWHHVASTYNGSEMKLYIDGTLDGTTNRTGAIVNGTAAVLIGFEARGNSVLFNGKIDEAVVYNRVLPAEEIAERVNSTPAEGSTSTAVSYWKFDEGSGTTASDSIDSNPGTIGGGAAWSSGRIAASLRFDGINDYVDIGNPDNLKIKKAITLEAWVKTGSNQWQTIISKWGSGNNLSYELAITGSGTAYFTIANQDGFNTPLLGTSVINNGQWHHLVGTYGNGEMKIYVDGVFEGTTVKSGDIGINDVDVRIGHEVRNNNWFNGDIDEVVVYPRILPIDEIQVRFSTAIVGPLGAEVSSLDKKAQIQIPAGSLSDDTEIIITNVGITGFTLGSGQSFVGSVYTFGPEGTQFDPNATITLFYDDAQVTNENNLDIYLWDGNQFVAQNGTVDTVNNKITLSVSHLSEYAILETTPEQADTTPPVITVELQGGQDQNNVYRTDVTIQVNAHDPDPGSGLASIFCNLDSAGFNSIQFDPQGVANPIIVSSEGEHTITCYSVDHANNESERLTKTFTIDKHTNTPVITKMDGQNVLAGQVTSNNPTPTVEGTAAVGDTVRLYKVGSGSTGEIFYAAGPALSAINNGDGTYTFDGPGLQFAGQNYTDELPGETSSNGAGFAPATDLSTLDPMLQTETLDGSKDIYVYLVSVSASFLPQSFHFVVYTDAIPQEIAAWFALNSQFGITAVADAYGIVFASGGAGNNYIINSLPLMSLGSVGGTSNVNLGEAVVDNDGNWLINVTMPFDEGANQIFAIATDEFSNSATSDTVTYNLVLQVDADNDGVLDADDKCVNTAGKALYQGCPVADKNTVTKHITTVGAGSTKASHEGAMVKVFDRNILATTSYTKNPSKTLYGALYEDSVASSAIVGTCTTDSSGVCYAGEETAGDYLVIVKVLTDDNKTIYIGLPKSPSDFKDTDNNSTLDLATKEFQYIKVIKKDGSVEYRAAQQAIITGSKLEIIYPDFTVWDGGTELYPFIFTSDDNWTVDVCLQVPTGYKVSGGSCDQVFVKDETKTLFFEAIETSSPEPNFKLTIKAKHDGETTKLTKKLAGKRITKAVAFANDLKAAAQNVQTAQTTQTESIGLWTRLLIFIGTILNAILGVFGL